MLRYRKWVSGYEAFESFQQTFNEIDQGLLTYLLTFPLLYITDSPFLFRQFAEFF